ncbi:3803_t:CDS:2 [Funneliformis geosporum]|uniref:3803_t:CDS:1 n=1 Tax=Funneliformis geosporum TaxID=1117311 RepID=A0A9W4SHL3_9GLOM|nr:3803_t:CDS:2 [Funneliformis geosporum]
MTSNVLYNNDNDEIPIIDFSIECSKKIKYACEYIGFCYLKNHGISNEFINEMFSIAKEFFIGISREEQLRYIMNDEYFGFVDLKQEACHDLCMKVLQSLAISLKIEDNEEGEGKNWFSKRHGYGMKSGDNFRILHYPPITIEEGKVSEDINYNQDIRAGSHTDYGSITLLFQKEIGGLEIQHPYTKKWIQVPVVPNAILINIGDLMEFWTKGLFKSTKHRVLFNKENMHLHRYSIAYFCHAGRDIGLDPIPSEFIIGRIREGEGIDEMNERKRITAGEHLRFKQENTYKPIIN